MSSSCQEWPPDRPHRSRSIVREERLGRTGLHHLATSNREPKLQRILGAAQVAGLGHWRQTLWSGRQRALRSHMTGMVQAQSLRGYRELSPTSAVAHPTLAWSRRSTGGPRPTRGLRQLREPDRSPGALGDGPRLPRLSGCAWPNVKTSAFSAPWPWRCATRPRSVRLCAVPPEDLQVYNAAIAFTIAPGNVGPSPTGVPGPRPARSSRWAQTAEHGIGLAWRIMTLLSEGRCHLEKAWFPIRPWHRGTYRSRFDAPLPSGPTGRPRLRGPRLRPAHQSNDNLAAP